MNDTISNIYQNHHRSSREEGYSVMKKERGSFLKNCLGQRKKILDIGCRDGALTQYFIESNDVLGVDIDKPALLKAEKDLGLKTLYLDLNGDWSELSAQKFEAVVAGEILEHLYYPENVIEKIKKVLIDGGIFVGSVPNAFSLKNRFRYLFGQKKNTPLSDPTHINHFSYQELKLLLQKHFDKVSIIGLGRYTRLARIFPVIFAFDLAFWASGPKS